jgi:4-amino-4-deoxy-L-arabinose transferase-like glycosyltransferase
VTETEAAPSRTVLCWLVAAVVWFAPLGYRDLVHADEGRYSEISREMVATGDWVTPRLGGLKYFEKPPLQYWASAISMKLFGLSEFAARLYTALAGFLTIVVVGFTARRLWGSQAGALAAIATGSMTWVMGLGHVVTLDMGLTLYLTLALCGFLLAREASHEADRRRWMWLVWIAMAGAVLSKGLIGAVIPGAVLFLYSAIHRQWQLWRRMEWTVGLALFFALTVPWFVLVSQRNPEFAQFFFVHEHFERYLTSGHDRGGAPWYFLPLLLGGLMPWTTLAPQFLRYTWTAPGSVQPANRVLFVWLGFILVFFSVSSSKLPGYILPMFPAMGLLLGQYLAQAPAQTLRRHAWLAVAFWSLVGLAAPIVVQYLSTRSTPREINLALGPWAIAAASAFVVFSIGAARAAGSGRRLAAAYLFGMGSLVGLQFVNGAYQLFSPIRSAKNIAAQAAPFIDDATELFVIRSYDRTLPYYLRRTPTPVVFTDEFALGEKMEPHKYVPTLDEFRARWLAAGKAVAFTSPDTLRELQASGVPMEVIGVHIRHAAFRKPATP